VTRKEVGLLKLFLKALLGFERKARLFCDEAPECHNHSKDNRLGFERKARLFCDHFRHF